ncbi:MAG: metalloregulator ArsR/SmtB family transcription factor [Atopobiaceae bacterium]|jgi:ArsR family transcriptional regulator|nr:metalloregulator ArsR/SmtB family transcription factor [Atopobiaceae bacterium]MCH4180539.1 metalloregulator ArsR/SmtB family transcription factor [Atopobiaceae bacterium]MCH4214264.1 metalloregulator ArsR/SmtB family transcription factor [Atopobiaceae bacterium]MCH4229439.1 metalloregulator ArsR/SmtB family transcription factor [Atopobiaceae bacterium]MCH4276089.1 metalloregulator ArsR/SmtB family transcription factor [Atopobiaceae bacterium]
MTPDAVSTRSSAPSGSTAPAACTPALDASALASALADDSVVYAATQIFDALSDYTRFQILAALAQGPCCVADLTDVCHVSQSAISHQLRLLRDRGLVAVRRDGQRQVYSLDDDHVALLIQLGLAHAVEHPDPTVAQDPREA